MTPCYVFTSCNTAHTTSIAEFLECHVCEAETRSCHTAAFARVRERLPGRDASVATAHTTDRRRPEIDRAHGCAARVRSGVPRLRYRRVPRRWPRAQCVTESARMTGQ